MNAALTLKVTTTGDVQIAAHLNDVANTDLSDYTGSLRATMPVRITDKLNTPHPGGPGAATTQPFLYGFTIPCAADPGPTTGSDCALTTSMNALAPGTPRGRPPRGMATRPGARVRRRLRRRRLHHRRQHGVRGAGRLHPVALL